MTEADLRSIFPQFKFVYFEQGSKTELQKVTVKSPASNLWKYLIGMVLALLLVETVLAQMFGAKR